MVQKWAENPYWQFFCGGEYFETRLPCDPSGLTRFRRALGDAGGSSFGAESPSCALASGWSAWAGGQRQCGPAVRLAAAN
ncbi:MAG: transposase [Zoogloea sp.]|nr:transposase [Zoogloea sp.]